MGRQSMPHCCIVVFAQDVPCLTISRHGVVEGSECGQFTGCLDKTWQSSAGTAGGRMESRITRCVRDESHIQPGATGPSISTAKPYPRPTPRKPARPPAGRSEGAQ